MVYKCIINFLITPSLVHLFNRYYNTFVIVIFRMILQCSMENDKLLINDESCFRTTKACNVNPNETTSEYVNQYNQNDLSE